MRVCDNCKGPDVVDRLRMTFDEVDGRSDLCIACARRINLIDLLEAVGQYALGDAAPLSTWSAANLPPQHDGAAWRILHQVGVAIGQPHPDAIEFVAVDFPVALVRRFHEALADPSAENHKLEIKRDPALDDDAALIEAAAMEFADDASGGRLKRDRRPAAVDVTPDAGEAAPYTRPESTVDGPPEDLEAIDRFLVERLRQIGKGWTPAHDDEHKSRELASAAAELLFLYADRTPGPDNFDPGDARAWGNKQWKQWRGEPLRVLEVVGAWVISEWSRLRRRGMKPAADVA